MKKAVRILLVEDNPDHVAIIRRALRREAGYDFSIQEFSDGVAAISTLQKSTPPPDLVLLDLKIPGKDGMEVLREIKERTPDIPVIMMTSYASIETAVSAIREGAFDYLTKPFRNPQSVILSLTKALRHRDVLLENRFLRRHIGKRERKKVILGNSPEMMKIHQVIEKIAPTQSTVLITGESGTGKEVLASYIHQKSHRANEKFIAVNCSALPESLLESELFGHVKGSFTGAVVNKIGLLKEADRGTFFFDEIAELTMAMQTKLLRFLQDHEIRQIGSVRSEVVDVRILAASNLNLGELVEKGRFREDLFYRLNVIHIHLPALTARREEIPEFITHFIDDYNHQEGRNIRGIEEEALRHLIEVPWPGNIRQLKNVIERALIFTEDGDKVPLRALGFLGPSGGEKDGARRALPLPFGKARQRALAEFTNRYLKTLLKEHRGNVTLAALAAGLGRQSFHRLLKIHQIQAQDFR